MDLLRVISHHRARLATPVRTLQKIYTDADLDNIPYADSTFNGAGTVSNRPLLVIESPNKINADDKTKTRSARATVDQDNKTPARTKLDTKTDDKVVPDTKVKGNQDSEVDTKVIPSNSDVNGNSKTAVTPKSDPDKAIGLPTNMPTKQGERKPATSRPVLEENIVLGVALEGSKRTLPIDEGIDTLTTQEAKEMATCQGGNGSPKAPDGNVK